jgi:uncharacterized repeat protein (TIGR03803 family)
MVLAEGTSGLLLSTNSGRTWENVSILESQIVSATNGYPFFAFGGTIYVLERQASTNSAPQITTQPSRQLVSAGTMVRFEVAAIGTPTLSFQWQFNGHNLANTSRISGSQSNVLTISNIAAADSGTYQVVVTNLFGAATSSVAPLAVGLDANAGDQVLHSFGGISSHDGDGPNTLLFGHDGALYGTTRFGGTNEAHFPGDGTIFKINTNGSGYAVLHRFNNAFSDGTDGQNPTALLQGKDGMLYCATLVGSGAGPFSDSGTVSRLNTNGGSYAIIQPTFGAGDGINPVGLIQANDSLLYGTTSSGGTNSGTLFKMSTSGSGFADVHIFGIAMVDGWFPGASLLQGIDGNLYGTTDSGGDNNLGTVFKVNTGGTTYSILHSFGATTNDGSEPKSLLQGADGALYGVTHSGGTFNQGTVFKLNSDGTGYTVLYNIGASDATHPSGPLTQGPDGALYGAADYGTFSDGAVFKVNIDGSGYVVLYTFGVNRDVGFPPTALVAGSDATLYGATGDGYSSAGTIFRLILSPQITIQPTNNATVFNGTVTLTAGASGVPPLFFHWQHNGTNLFDNSHISGSQADVLTIANASSADAGNYRVIVTNAYGIVTSSVVAFNVAALVVLPSAQIDLAGPGNAINLQALLATNLPNTLYEWCYQSTSDQPDQLIITDPASPNTTVLFGFAGTYLLSLTAAEGTYILQTQVAITVAPSTNGVFQNVSNYVNGPLLTNGNVFLSKFANNSIDASNYFNAIDPGKFKTNLTNWKIANGIPTVPIPPTTTNFMNGIVSATYFNSLDLGFGRRMIMKGAPDGDWAFAVSNYRNADDAIDDRNKIATVTMEYSAVAPGTARFTKFYIFDGHDNRIEEADLDHGGTIVVPKVLPGLCIMCHGGTPGPVTVGVTNVHAHFLAFDLLNALDYSCNSNFTRAAQEPAFKLLNLGVLAIEQDIAKNDPSNACPSIPELIQGWYGPDFANPTQYDDFVPAGWQDTNGPLTLSAQAYLYQNVVAPSCRSCHETRSVSRNLDFGTFANWHAKRAAIKADVFGTDDIGSGTVILNPNSIPNGLSTMPQARRTFQRFWNSLAPRPQPEILSDYLNGVLGLNSFIEPPVFLGFRLVGNDVLISFSTSFRGGYQLEHSDSLTSPDWTSIGGVIAGNGGVIQVNEPVPANHQAGFYRLLVISP